MKRWRSTTATSACRVVMSYKGLIGLSSTKRLIPGEILRIGDGDQEAVTLFSRSGSFFAIPIAGRQSNVRTIDTVALGTEAIATGEFLSIRTDPVGIGGRVIDWTGALTDGDALREESALRRQLFGPVPLQADLQPIHRSFHSGILAIDALTPIGRGQTMLLIGQEGTGKSTLAWDALLAQARSDVHCVLALTTGSASLAAAKLAELERRGDGLHRRTTIVAVAREGAAERLLTVASAAAVAEAVRDSGGHALLIVDDLGGLLDAWDIAGEAVDAQRAGRGCSSLDKHGSSEQRIFFASLLQRAAQLKESKGSGSLTMLLLVTQPTPLRPAMPSTPACFTLDDFASHSPAERKRVEALASRGIPLDAATLTKIRIPLPTRRGGSPDTAHGARDAAERQVAAHTDQLKSLADGHIYLHADLAAAGRFPSIRADECLGRVGAGSDIDKRPQPMTAAMSEISPSLRLELAQALDLPPVDLDSFTRDQRLRVRSTDALLRSQQPGKPRRLSEELVLLHALLQGRLDHLADRTTEEVNAEVASVIQGVEAILGPSALDAIDGTGRLEGDMKVQFAAAIAKQLPKARGRAFFVSYDKDTWQERSADKQTDGTH